MPSLHTISHTLKYKQGKTFYPPLFRPKKGIKKDSSFDKSLLLNCRYLSSKQVEEHLSQEMFRNACAFHTFFLGVSQVPEPRKVWCHKLSVGHSSWLCTAFFYSTVFNGSNRTTFNSGLELADNSAFAFDSSNRTTFNSGLKLFTATFCYRKGC